MARDETELFPLSTCMQANTNIPPKKKKKKKIQGNAKLACPKLKVLVKNQRLQRWKLLHLVGCFGKLNPGIISHIKNKIKKERLQIHHPLYWIGIGDPSLLCLHPLLYPLTLQNLYGYLPLTHSLTIFYPPLTHCHITIVTMKL